MLRVLKVIMESTRQMKQDNYSKLLTTQTLWTPGVRRRRLARELVGIPITLDKLMRSFNDLADEI